MWLVAATVVSADLEQITGHTEKNRYVGCEAIHAGRHRTVNTEREKTGMF